MKILNTFPEVVAPHLARDLVAPALQTLGAPPPLGPLPLEPVTDEKKKAEPKAEPKAAKTATDHAEIYGTEEQQMQTQI